MIYGEGRFAQYTRNMFRPFSADSNIFFEKELKKMVVSKNNSNIAI